MQILWICCLLNQPKSLSLVERTSTEVAISLFFALTFLDSGLFNRSRVFFFSDFFELSSFFNSIELCKLESCSGGTDALVKSWEPPLAPKSVLNWSVLPCPFADLILLIVLSRFPFLSVDFLGSDVDRLCKE